MRKWRPTHKCIYIVPEVQGALEPLNIIINRILPLRFSIGQEDELFFLGNYIGKGKNSAQVVEKLCELNNNYPDQIFFIKGKTELQLLKALCLEEYYHSWLLPYGLEIIQSYIDLAGLNTESISFPFNRLPDIIPQHHIRFLNNLPAYLELDDYIMFHGGFDYFKPIKLNSEESIITNTYYSQQVKQKVKLKQASVPNESKVLIGSFNYKSKLPFIYAKYFMLGGGAPRRLVLFELNSMTCAMVRDNKSRIYKHNFKFFE